MLVVFESLPPLTLPALNDAKIVILRHLKQQPSEWHF